MPFWCLKVKKFKVFFLTYYKNIDIQIKRDTNLQSSLNFKRLNLMQYFRPCTCLQNNIPITLSVKIPSKINSLYISRRN